MQSCAQFDAADLDGNKKVNIEDLLKVDPAQHLHLPALGHVPPTL